jgi:hypothetical protein
VTLTLIKIKANNQYVQISNSQTNTYLVEVGAVVEAAPAGAAPVIPLLPILIKPLKGKNQPAAPLPNL